MATAQKKRGKSARKKLEPMVTPIGAATPEADVLITSEDDQTPVGGDLEAGILEIEGADGLITIQLPVPYDPKKDSTHGDNLAEELDETQLGRIVTPLLDNIGQDDNARSDWLQQRTDGLDLLGQKVEKPGGGSVGTSATAVPGQATVRDPILSEAIDQFQATTFAELCPSEGPVKVVNYGEETAENDKLAEDLEKDLNYYLTGSGQGTAKEYYPDTRRMLWWVGYASGMFKKVYACPLRRRPVSESVDGADLIVPSNVTDLANAGRVTHQITMRQSTMKRMQLLGVYRDVKLTTPTPRPNALAEKEASLVGLSAMPEPEEDQEYTLYECYCELDIEGYEHKEDGEITGLPLPYRVTIDKDSRQILEIRRNWNEDDEDYTAKIPFVPFLYATGLGFYGTGLLHRLGNYAMALTAMLRESIDAGMFASFPGFLYAKPLGRQLQNEFRVPPGGGAPIDVSAVGGNIQNAVMPLPYKDVSTAFVALMEQTRQHAGRYAGMANTQVAEGKQDAPVGTTLAMIEQNTKVEGGVHKSLHGAQAEELRQLKELFKEDPEALWRGNKRPALGPTEEMRMMRFKQALENCELVPASDPNVPSNMHRLAKANAYLQQAVGMPGLFNMQSVVKRWADMVRLDGIEADFAPAAQGPDPAQQAMMADLAIKKQNADTKQMQVQLTHQTNTAKLSSTENVAAMKMASTAGEVQGQPQPDPFQSRALDIKQQQVNQADTKMALDAYDKHLDRQSKENVEALKVVQTVGVHPISDPIVDQQMQQMHQFLSPSAGKAPTPGVGGGAAPSGGPLADGGAVDPEMAYHDPNLGQGQEQIQHLHQVLDDYKDLMRGSLADGGFVDNSYEDLLQQPSQFERGGGVHSPHDQWLANEIARALQGMPEAGYTQ